MDEQTGIKISPNIEKMKYLDYCKSRNIPTFPIALKYTKTDILLENGHPKIKKELDLKFDCGSIVTTNDFDNVDLMKARWKSHIANPGKYNAFASCTRANPIIDIDCILPDLVDGRKNIIIKMGDTHPNKKSLTKEGIGKHICVDLPTSGKRTKTNPFPKKYGREIDFLNGLWEWSALNDIIEFPERSTQCTDEIKNFIPTAEEHAQQQDVVPMATIVNDAYDIEDIRDNLFNFKASYLRNYNKWGGIVLACASSQDEAVYEVLKEACQRPNAGWDTDEALRNKWNEWTIDTDPKYANTFIHKISQKYVVPNNWDEIGNEHEYIEDDFIKNHFSEFINVPAKMCEDGVCWFDNTNKMWEMGKGKAKKRINTLLCGVVRSRLMKAWNKKLKKEADLLVDAPNEWLENAHKDHRKFVYKMKDTLMKRGYIGDIAGQLLDKLIFQKSLKKDIQFNLETNTEHYFQFKNGAFNLKTGILEPRTREMYITQCLDYDYDPNQDLEIKNKIERIFKKILPDDEYREGFLKWRGLCLTGDTTPQKFVLNLGHTAGNGKSTMSNLFQESFPIYCEEIGSDCFDKGNGTAYNKCMSCLEGQPKRLIFMEEWGENTQDTKLIKSTVSKNTIKVKPLYKEEVKMNIQFKLEASSNNDPSTEKLDQGLIRRGLMIPYSSKFTDDGTILDDSKHIYKIDKGLLDNFKNDNYKLGLFHYFAPYSKLFYEEGLKMPDRCAANFKQLIEESDPYSEIMDLFEPAKTNLSKSEIIERIKDHCTTNPSSDVNTKWALIKQEFEKKGYKYDSQMRKKANCTTIKGFVLGIQIIPPSNQGFLEETDEEKDELD